MKDYVVKWRIDITAETPEAAARNAWDHMRRLDSSANVFDVIDDGGQVVRVDLDELEQEGGTT